MFKATGDEHSLFTAGGQMIHVVPRQGAAFIAFLIAAEGNGPKPLLKLIPESAS